MSNPILPYSDVGCVDSICPSCGVELAKRPVHKTKCPSCSAFILVRTRPLDRKRVLVTAQDAKQLEAEWAVYHEIGPFMTASALVANKSDLEKHRRRMILECRDARKVGVRVGIEISPSPGCTRSNSQAKIVYQPEDLPGLPLEGCDRFQQRGCACCYVPIVLK